MCNCYYKKLIANWIIKIAEYTKEKNVFQPNNSEHWSPDRKLYIHRWIKQTESSLILIFIYTKASRDEKKSRIFPGQDSEICQCQDKFQKSNKSQDISSIRKFLCNTKNNNCDPEQSYGHTHWINKSKNFWHQFYLSKIVAAQKAWNNSHFIPNSDLSVLQS